ncbi:hypothetical protein EDD17DRAFT_1512553 [Pisolithus thermaeus]|nr:hypothetical protein EDD17DRAFT_1512553 [Pisolithus thermaeus]
MWNTKVASWNHLMLMGVLGSWLSYQLTPENEWIQCVGNCDSQQSVTSCEPADLDGCRKGSHFQVESLKCTEGYETYQGSVWVQTRCLLYGSVTGKGQRMADHSIHGFWKLWQDVTLGRKDFESP